MIRNVHGPSRRDQKKAMRSRAWLNSVEITNRCYYADDRAGVVRVYLLNVDGKKYLASSHEVAKAEFHGRVRIGRSA